MCQCFAHSTGCKRTETSVCQLSWHTFQIYKGVGGGRGKKTFKFQCVHPPLPSFPLPSSLSPFPSPSSWLLQWWTAQQWKPGYGNRWGIQCHPTQYHELQPTRLESLGTNGRNFLRGSGSNSICHIAGENKCGLLAHFNFWPGKFKEKKDLSNSHPIQRQENSYKQWTLPFIRVNFWIPWWPGNLSCPAVDSGKMFYSFHTMSFVSMTCLRSPLLHNCSLRAALPAAMLCSTAFTILCQETNCFHYCPTCDPTGLMLFSVPHSPFCNPWSWQKLF